MKKSIIIGLVLGIVALSCTSMENKGNCSCQLKTKDEEILIKQLNFNGKSYILSNDEFKKFKIGINFEANNSVYGFSGVNTFSGTYNIEGNKINFSPLARTLMLGFGDNQKSEDKFIKLLSEVETIYFENGNLVLGTKNEEKLIFEEIKSLEDKKYMLASSPYNNFEVTIKFKDGNIYGKSVVNRYFGTYKYENGSLNISSIGSTRMSSSEEEMQLEYQYLNSLMNIKTVKLESNSLFITTKDDKVLRFIEIED